MVYQALSVKCRQAGEGKNVSIASASILQQCIRAGLLDEIQIDLVPVLLGGGVRLFDNLGTTPPGLAITHIVAAPDVTHITFRFVK